MKLAAVIPVRMGASRLPGKPLLDLGGRPVVQWVCDAVRDSGLFSTAVVATPDEEVRRAVEHAGFSVMMTPDCETGTDRVALAARDLADDVIVNVQGDQPFVTSEMLAALVAPFDDGNGTVMSTLGIPLRGDVGLNDPHTVKVLADQQSNAIYFSRASIPYGDPIGAGVNLMHHLGLYAFDRSTLMRFASLPPTALERCEGLEQLRAIDHGISIRVVPLDALPILEINTPADLAAARALVDSQ